MDERIAHLADLARLDLDRVRRAGIPEVVLGEGKKLPQLIEIVVRLADEAGRALVSRIPEGWLAHIAAGLPDRLELEEHAGGSLAVVRARGAANARVEPTGGVVGVLTAGTADIPVAEEARVIAVEMGCEVIHHYDVGIAGVHRVVKPIEEILERGAAVVVAVAGMDGALPTLVKGLLPVPVIGVPTSTGYGLGRPGEAALLTMLNSCAPGLTVVNVDNGIGAGATAALIANRVALAERT